MKQRTKLGLAFFTKADMIFLDEPGTNLDKASFDWYWRNLDKIPPKTMVIIASNQEQEYPVDSIKVNILDYK
jgi:ABC-type multidrug transport system ATPase subunit